jgi:hypothetical protein
MNEREQQLYDTIKAIAAEKPDFIYDPGRDEYGRKLDCSYFPTPQQPSPCIIGEALNRVGSSPVRADEGSGAADVLYGRGYLNPILLDFAESTQVNQDGGVPWGRAVAYAEVYALRQT